MVESLFEKYRLAILMGFLAGVLVSAVASRVRIGTGSVGLACSRVLCVANYDTGHVLKIDLGLLE